MRPWTEEERKVFADKFLLHHKASWLPTGVIAGRLLLLLLLRLSPLLGANVAGTAMPAGSPCATAVILPPPAHQSECVSVSPYPCRTSPRLPPSCRGAPCRRWCGSTTPSRWAAFLFVIALHFLGWQWSSASTTPSRWGSVCGSSACVFSAGGRTLAQFHALQWLRHEAACSPRNAPNHHCPPPCC